MGEANTMGQIRESKYGKANTMSQGNAPPNSAMPDLKSSDDGMARVLTQGRVIAVVGHSHKPHRDSYRVAQFLRTQGYTIYPVNPRVKVIDGQPTYPTLQAVPEPIDIVNIFRRSEYLPDIARDAIAVQAKTLWTQLGIKEAHSAQMALDAGLNVVMDACIKIEYGRLGIDRQRSLEDDLIQHDR